MEVFDFLLNYDGDLGIKDGDIAFGESTLEHQHDLLLAQPGDIRMSPLIGVGIRSMLLDTVEQDDLRIGIQKEMERDGMRISRLRISPELTLEMNASYE